MKSIFALTVSLAILPVAAFAQSSLPRCSDEMPVIQNDNAFLDSEGYPLQAPISVQSLVVTTTDPCLDRYVFATDAGPVVAPDAEITYSGRWERIAFRRVAGSGESEEISYSAGFTVSTEVAREISGSLSLSATGGFKPLGVGGEVTVEGSIGYALAIANGTENSQDWEHTVSVNPGEEIVIWARRLTVHVEWTPSETYSFTNIFDSARRFIDETYFPTRIQEFMESPDISESAAAVIVEPIRILYVFDVPPTTGPDLMAHARALTEMGSFLTRYDETLTSEYQLPMRETYTVRYNF